VEQFPQIEIGGAPYERGRQYGEQAAELIRFNLTAYWQLFQHQSGLCRSAVLKQVLPYLEPIKGYAPHLVEEMLGIAAGAGVLFEEILALNCRTELLSMGLIPLLNECTAFYVAPEKAAGGAAWLAQNWDWAEITRGGMILLRIEQLRAPTVLTLTEAGMVGKIGINSAGVGVCTNFLRHAHRRVGVPYHVILREALNAASLGLAAAKIYRAGRADAGNYLIAHAEGEAIDLEATPTEVGFHHPREGLLVHTNHFLAERLQGGDRGILESDNTLVRYGRAMRLLNLMGDQAITITTVKSVLRDHFNHSKAICRHSDPIEERIEQSATLASMIVELGAGRMDICCGEPCLNHYYSVEI
jgi:isopenicillin-N N-acyltransferase-like protein